MIVLIALLALRFFTDWQLAAKFYSGQTVKLNFCLSDQPFYNQENQTFYYQNHFQKLKIIVPVKPKLDFGDCLQILGKISTCENTSRSERCLLNPQISAFEGETGFRFLTSNFLKKLRIFRDKIADSFFRILPYPESDLLSGIVLGIKKNLDPKFYSQLRSTGTLHIIVASGYNLSLIGRKPINFLSYLLGRELAIIFSFLLVWLYVGIVGFEPPIIRAAIMVSFLFLAQLFGRRFSQWRALSLSIWLMLIFKPDLIASVSFQLSIAALVGIILGEKLFKVFRRLPFFGPELAETLSAQLMVLPIIAWHFGKVSWLSPLANALILPIIPYLTGIGFLSLFFLWWPFLSRLMIWGLYPLLWWSILVTKRLSGLPTAEFSLKITGWQTVFLYLVLFFLFHKFSSKKRGRDLTKNGTRLSPTKSG